MNNEIPKGVGYSAEVQMRLSVNGFTLSIGQLGPDFLLLEETVDHPPSEAEISLSIDGDVSRWTVQLPDGISSGRSRTRIVHCED
jgi:hypothetical protein